MDPLSIGLMAFGIVSGVTGAALEAYKIISQKVAQHRRKKKEEKGEYTPYIVDDEDVKVLDTLPESDRQKVESLLNSASMAPDDFFDKLEKLDLNELEKAAQQQQPSAEQLGFPPNAPSFDMQQLMEGTDLNKFAESMIGKFGREEIPKITQRLVGQGQRPGFSSSFADSIQRGLSQTLQDINAQNAPNYLKRAQILGGLGQKEKALDIGRAETAGKLGLLTQNQPFEQQKAISALGLNQRGQDINQQQANQNAYLQLLGLSKGVPINPQNTGPSAGQSLIGAGLGGLGAAAKMYGNQSQQSQLTDIIGRLNQLDKNAGMA